ncbi:unnamed protein product [Brassica napus]|uniref:(rape) hypothetical protein n=1 Tax=Brassica napus TaxID=3708 RepID=A0A816JN51_BRANA|nr:unnamed protein product [Brassica napus]
MGKNSDEEQNLPENNDTARNNEGSRCSSCCCSARISRCFSLRCVLILAFSAAVFLSAVFWLPPFLGLSDRDDLDLDPRFKGHRIVASFDVEKPVSFLEDNLLQLENDITDEISFPMTKVVVLTLERWGNLNRTMVIFAIDPKKKNIKIPTEIESLIKAAFVSLVTNQLSFRLTESLFGQPFFFEVLKFPGGITVIPSQPVFPLQKAQLLFNFTLNFSIYQIQSNFEELTSQLKKGINLASYEVKQVRLSSILPHSPVKPLAPSPSPQPETHKHYYHHHRHRHHHQELAPEPSPAAKSLAPASAPIKHLHLHRRSPPPCPYEQRGRPKGNDALNHHSATPTPAPHRSQQHAPAPNHTPPSHHLAIPVSSPLPHVVFAHIPPPARISPESRPDSEKTPAPSPTPSSASIGPNFKRVSPKLLVIVTAVIICL